MPLRIGDTVADFPADTTDGSVRFHASTPGAMKPQD